jgi:hypothetical protein
MGYSAPSTMKTALLTLVLAACATGSDDPESDFERLAASVPSPTPVYASPTDDAATSVAVKNGMTLTLHASLAWGRGPTLVLRGSTGQDLSDVRGFIPDDAFGTATQLGPRSFEIVYDNASDIDTVLSGDPFYVILTTTKSVTFSAQVFVAERVVASDTTTNRLAIGSAITPTAVTTNPNGLVYRGTLTTTIAPQSIGLTTSSGIATLAQDAPHAWHADWSFSAFESVGVGGAITATANFGATTSTRNGTVEVRVGRVGLASGDTPDDIYGFPVCDPAVAACLQALPAGTTDYGSCGAFFPVTTCLNQ